MAANKSLFRACERGLLQLCISIAYVTMSGTFDGLLDQISESERGCAATEWADFQGLIAINGQKIQHNTTDFILGKP